METNRVSNFVNRLQSVRRLDGCSNGRCSGGWARATVRGLALAACGLLLISSSAIASEPSPEPRRVWEMHELAREQHLQSLHQDSILALPGVVGMGITLQGEQPAFLIMVGRGQEPPKLPSEIDGVPVVIEEVELSLADGGLGCNPCHADKLSLPVSMGTSTSTSLDCGAGTLGFKACDPATNTLGYVTNWHVATVGANGCQGSAPPKTPQIHRGGYDAVPQCSVEDTIGTLSNFIPVNPLPAMNLVDAAFVESSAGLTSPSILDIGIPSGTGDPKLSSCVRKSGRTTGLTYGKIDAVNMTFVVQDFCFGSAMFAGAFRFSEDAECGTCQFPPCHPVAIGGDSGSAVVDANSTTLVGLLFGVDSFTLGAIAAPATTVLNQLGLTLDLSQCSTQTQSFPVTEDAWVNENNSGANYGTSGHLQVRSAATGYGRHAYLKVTVSGITGTVQSAKLRIRTGATAFPAARVYHITDTSWQENTITWDNAPLGFLTQYPVGPLSANTWEELDVSPIITGNGTYTIGLVAYDTPGLYYKSRETLFKPTVIVTYQ